MSEPRLRTEFQARALLRQAAASDGMGVVLRRGDPDAGSLFLVLRERTGALQVLVPARDRDGAPGWRVAGGNDTADQDAVDAYLERQIRRDPDLWVVEIETGRPGLPPGVRLIED
ncbi:DUF1491 family protein [Rhizosaccharibacter radicis]|uniref:DUF1491 family protein n=1 Tax=Rhizosaccharibacter radicis TaxID=2782605 RepID=A0ABT1W1C9_9PROT|nr:DUF1491 family protein [Acetobacteraceae bacterium KSS12]